MRKLIRMLSLFLIMTLLLPGAAFAEDVCVVKDASTTTRVTTGCAYLQVRCPLTESTNVTLSVHDEWGSLIYQRNYGRCSGNFRSGDIHLPLSGESCDYIVTLATDMAEYAFTVTREQPMITDSAVYASGLTLKEMTGGSKYKHAVVLDLDALGEEMLTTPMVAGGKQIGEVYFTVLDGRLTVSAALTVTGQIDKANVYIATDAITASTFGASRFTGTKTKLNREISLGNAPYVAVMVQLTVTYDTEGAQTIHMGLEEQEAYEQLQENWRLMQLMTANEAVG